MDKLQMGLEILKILNTYSYEAFIVGGAVRDYILNEKTLDIDIATNAKPLEISQIFEEVHFEGTEYLSCRLLYKGYTFEITSFRKDLYYQDHRHPIVEATDTLEEDLKRRDFTMNALAMNWEGKILDKFHGQADIKNKKIRTIGDPLVRFSEDALRVLRALYFSSRFHFELDEAILDSFRFDFLKYLKEEYIIDMVNKIMAAPYENGLHYIQKYKVLRSFPFYQVLCEEVYRYHYRKNIYALFYTIHHFLPANIKISKEERKKAKDIAFMVLNQLDAIALYYGNMKYLEDAVELSNVFYKRLQTVDEIREQQKQLPIHQSKDIKIDWEKFPNQMRGILTKKIEYAILQEKIKNEEESIVKFIEIGE